MMFDHAWIAARIPHQEAMCLLDGVLEWDARRIVCRSESHRAGDNPLRSNGCLHAACGIEYAAQAMAVHGVIVETGSGRPRAGYLASVRSVAFHVDRLDDIPASLTIAAESIGGDGNNVIYRFIVSGDGKCLLEGRAAVILDAAGLSLPPQRAEST